MVQTALEKWMHVYVHGGYNTNFNEFTMARSPFSLTYIYSPGGSWCIIIGWFKKAMSGK